jgi:DNA-binding phage protein
VGVGYRLGLSLDMARLLEKVGIKDSQLFRSFASGVQPTVRTIHSDEPLTGEG